MTASKCSRQASQSESPIFGARSSAARSCSFLTSKTWRTLVARLCAISSSASSSGWASSHSLSRATYCGRQFASPIELSSSVPLGHAEPPQQLGVELDHLGVDGGIGRADRLERQLPVLAVAAAAGTRVAVHRRDRVRLDRLRLLGEAVLDVGARDRRRPLRAQRERAVAAVLERVHLLVHDVGRLARRALEERRLLEAGRGDARPAVLRALLLDRADHAPPQVVARQDVVRPARRLELGSRAHARSSARNGLRASSTPSVVSWPWPGWTTVSGGSRSASIRTEASSVSQSAPGRSTRPTEPAKRRSPLKSSPSA